MTKEYRVRLKAEEVQELRKALIYYMMDLVEGREMGELRWGMLYKLLWRLGRLGKVRSGAPTTLIPPLFWRDEDERYEKMAEIMEYRRLEVEEPEKFEEMKRRTLASLRF